MNISQWLSLLRSILKIGGGLLVARGVITDDQAATISSQADVIIGAVMMLAPIALDIYRNSTKAKIAAVASVPGVEGITVSKYATGAVADAANDPNLKNVNKAS